MTGFDQLFVALNEVLNGEVVTGVVAVFPECCQVQHTGAARYGELWVTNVSKPGNGSRVGQVSCQLGMRVIQKFSLAGNATHLTGQFWPLGEIVVPDVSVGQAMQSVDA